MYKGLKWREKRKLTQVIFGEVGGGHCLICDLSYSLGEGMVKQKGHSLHVNIYA